MPKKPGSKKQGGVVKPPVGIPARGSTPGYQKTIKPFQRKNTLKRQTGRIKKQKAFGGGR
jgi:hypothetical protein